MVRWFSFGLCLMMLVALSGCHGSKSLGQQAMLVMIEQQSEEGVPQALGLPEMDVSEFEMRSHVMAEYHFDTSSSVGFSDLTVLQTNYFDWSSLSFFVRKSRGEPWQLLSVEGPFRHLEVKPMGVVDAGMLFESKYQAGYGTGYSRYFREIWFVEADALKISLQTPRSGFFMNSDIEVQWDSYQVMIRDRDYRLSIVYDFFIVYQNQQDRLEEHYVWDAQENVFVLESSSQGLAARPWLEGRIDHAFE